MKLPEPDASQKLNDIARRISQFARNSEAAGKAAQDAISYGNGWLRVDVDGNLHRLDPTRISVDYKLD